MKKRILLFFMVGISLIASASDIKISGGQNLCPNSATQVYTIDVDIFGGTQGHLNYIEIIVEGGTIQNTDFIDNTKFMSPDKRFLSAGYAAGNTNPNTGALLCYNVSDRQFTMTIAWALGNGKITAKCNYWPLSASHEFMDHKWMTKEYKVSVITNPARPVFTAVPDMTINGSTLIKLQSSVPTATSYYYSVSRGSLIGGPETTATSVSYKATTVGTVNVQVTAINGCGSSLPGSTSFYVYPAPIPNDLVINGPTVGSPGQTLTWSVSMYAGQSPFSYNWSYKTITSSSYKPMGVGQSIGWAMPSSTHLYLNLKVTDANGNVVNKSFTVWNTVLGGNPMKSASIEDVITNTQNSSNTTSELSKKEGITNLEQNFSVFPNPSSGSFNLTSDIDSDYEVNIYNNLGALVWSKKLNSYKSTIDISNHPNGVYLIKVSQGSKVITQKILKN